ncbi:MAG: hypothetical protein ONB48_03200 [candidate division KSB1 bacterium]|nr:hypothetical protein [candidate division KSB1 bacterium]MDZ7275655.1 hypothetical protein [candidate division KSB1 bacterium]MDZ7284654.1 hypothetical protein [candidate division KSB1 bacterium]MDZ7297927.1 hypothetical protein [candidate division KSB1 bacterium]MDZ7307108.1 hypothetical protein [candidate division KSB1 bacterium]
MKRILQWSALLATAGMLLTACNQQQPVEAVTEADSSTELSLEKDFGGFTTSDEAPMFNDEDVIAEAVEDAETGDPLAVESLGLAATQNGVKAYFLRVKWGLLEFDSTATERVDWSGSIHITRGTLAALRKIAFEPGDYIQRPRSSRKEIAFTSTTQQHFDGLMLMIVDKDTAATAGELTITLGSYSRTFPYSDLNSLDLVEAVDATGHEVSIVSRSREVRPFAGGFLEGRWVKTNRQGGEFSGRWISSEGGNAGTLRGIWGERRNGEKVFFGKYISNKGEFGGLLAGHWDYTRGNQTGWFEGRWLDRNREATGGLKGHFLLGNNQGQRGFFAARWSKS